ncbi:MAG: purine-nucleoside phosphorylase [Clostridia bacterium]
MKDLYRSAVEIISKKIEIFNGIKFQTALILGSGLGTFEKKLQNAVTIPYSDIDGFPISSAPSHEGRLIIGTVGEKGVVCMSGRTHFYEGKTPVEITFPIRVFSLLGIKNLVVTNAAGGINRDFSAGDFMIITDHINMLPNPLIGENDKEFGDRFPDMTYAYSPELIKKARAAALKNGINIRDGVYIAVSGPSFETPAEIRAFRALGADAVGMSTVPEVIVANHCGMNVLGISLISNSAAGISKTKISGGEVIDAADKSACDFGKLIQNIIELI